MDELISRLVASTGIDEALANKAVEIILGFLKESGPEDKVAELLDAMPGARDAADAAPGGIGGMMGAMGAFNALTSAGLDMGQIQGVTKEVIGFAREKAGADVVDDVVGSIPGLSQFV